MSLAALGALLLGAVALWNARAWAPPGRSHLVLDAVLLSTAAAVVVGSVGIWAEGERPAGMMQLALLAGAAIAAASAIGGAIGDRAPRWTDLLALAAPAAGVLGIASTLTIAEWIETRGNAMDDGLALTFWGSIALTVAAVASLALRARRRTGP